MRKAAAFPGSILGPILALLALTAGAAGLQRSPAPPGARVYIISPADGETVPPEFTVRFGLSGMGVAPAGVDKENTGHHHLIVDGELPQDLNQPMGGGIRHFGAGQTEVSLSLPPGRHSLQLILGDRQHLSFDPPLVSEKISITVRQP